MIGKVSTTVHKAFDLIVGKTFVAKDTVTSLEPYVQNTMVVGSTFNNVWYWYSGKTTYTNTKTNETITFERGDDTLTTPIPSGEWNATFAEDTRILCLMPHNNPNKLPLSSHLTKFFMKAGDAQELPIGTKLFVGEGSIEINGNTIQGPREVYFKTENKTVKAISDVFGFIIL